MSSSRINSEKGVGNACALAGIRCLALLVPQKPEVPLQDGGSQLCELLGTSPSPF